MMTHLCDKRLLLAALIIIFASILFSCSSNSEIYCEDCNSQIYVDENAAGAEDDEGNSHDVDMYTCKDCAYAQGYMEGYNKCVREIEENKYNIEEITNIYHVPSND